MLNRQILKGKAAGVFLTLCSLSLSCVPLLPAALQDSSSGPKASASPLRAAFALDAAQSVSADLNELKTLMKADPPLEAERAAQPPAWLRWGRFYARRLRVTTSPGLPAERVGVYASSSPSGAALFIKNGGEVPLEASVKMRLPAGVYKVERLRVSSPSALQNFIGAALSSSSSLTKTLTLEAGETAILRVTNVAREARVGYDDALSQIKILSASYPEKSSRLRRILKEGEAYVSALSSTRGGQERRVSAVHQLTLYVSQAHALCRNYQSRNAVKEEGGANVMGALERLADALSETSAALLQMTPQIALTQEKAKGIANVEVSLCNSGGRTAATVKLALDGNSLPQGVHMESSEPALFDAVKSGQTVRANFKLILNRAEPLQPSQCVGDISYFVGKSPAHLRPRVW